MAHAESRRSLHLVDPWAIPIEGASLTETTITPHLNFGGRCEEALDFHHEAIGAEVEAVMKFSEGHEPVPPGVLQPGFENKVMHASFRVRGVLLMASDGCSDQTKFDGFQLALALPNESDARKAFEALPDGGRVEMSLGKTFWSPCFGMVEDRFGLAWMVMVNAPCA